MNCLVSGVRVAEKRQTVVWFLDCALLFSVLVSEHELADIRGEIEAFSVSFFLKLFVRLFIEAHEYGGGLILFFLRSAHFDHYKLLISIANRNC